MAKKAWRRGPPRGRRRIQSKIAAACSGFSKDRLSTAFVVLVTAVDSLPLGRGLARRMPTGSYSTWSTHIHATSAKAHPRRCRRTLRALARTAGFGLVRGIATACGTALVGAVVWWTQHH